VVAAASSLATTHLSRRSLGPPGGQTGSPCSEM
jgi:hypothetical protein